MMNWIQFELFLIKQLETFRTSTDSKDFQDLIDLQESVNIVPELFARHHPIHSPMADMEFNASGGPSRSFNWTGLGVAYRNHFMRTLRDIPIVLGTTGYLEGAKKLNQVLSRDAMYRKLPMALAIGGMFNNIQLIRMYVADLTSGDFPGTDESIFI